jgi:hypothetical protein
MMVGHECVVTAIRRELGASPHPLHVGRDPEALGWTRQKPVRRARQRDEELIQQTVARSANVTPNLPEQARRQERFISITGRQSSAALADPPSLALEAVSSTSCFGDEVDDGLWLSVT